MPSSEKAMARSWIACSSSCLRGRKSRTRSPSRCWRTRNSASIPAQKPDEVFGQLRSESILQCLAFRWVKRLVLFAVEEPWLLLTQSIDGLREVPARHEGARSPFGLEGHVAGAVKNVAPRYGAGPRRAYASLRQRRCSGVASDRGLARDDVVPRRGLHRFRPSRVLEIERSVSFGGTRSGICPSRDRTETTRFGGPQSVICHASVRGPSPSASRAHRALSARCERTGTATGPGEDHAAGDGEEDDCCAAVERHRAEPVAAQE